MHEPPSEQLVRQLTELQLCHLRDLHQARGKVRRLSFDLPAFDSVWIDSLVQLRFLTPYQARQLEQGNGDGLRIGAFVAIDELGRSAENSTYLARRLNRRDRCVIKRHRVTADQLEETRRRLTDLLEKLNGFVHPHLVVPHEIVPSDENELVVVSRFVPGIPLNELLVRRGRFPATVVLEIGRQLFEGMAALHNKSLVHGDIRLTNIRLTESGLAVLVNGAVRPAIHPFVTIHDPLSLDALNGLAPERIGTGIPATASSEMYAIGCVLWQLLTGRPPFVSADPLAKIAAHQTQTIEDVRAWAPDTPEMLANSIRQLTMPSPSSRPRSFQEVLQNWGHSGSFGRSRLRQFRRLFNGSIPHFLRTSTEESAGKWIWMAAAMVGFVSGAALLYDKGLRTELLNLGSGIRSIVGDSQHQRAEQPQAVTSESAVGAERIQGLLPLPAPNSEGVVLLNKQGPYTARSIAVDGGLTIRSAPGIAAEIVIGHVPLSLSAHDVCLDRVAIRGSNDDRMMTAMSVESDNLRLVNCEFLGRFSEESEENRGQVLSDPRNGTQSHTSSTSSIITWSRTADHDSEGGTITIQNCVFHGDGVSLLLTDTPQTVRVENSLKTGLEAFVALGPKTTATKFSLDLERVTLRKSGALLQVDGEFASRKQSDSIRIAATDCVFQLRDSHAALILVDSNQVRDDLEKSIELTALDSVVEPGITLFARFDPAKDRLVELNGDDQFQGLIASELKFVGSQIHRTDDAKIAAVQGPRSSEARLPGIAPSSVGLKPKR